MFLHEPVRLIPKQFSWLDQRLVQEGHIDRLSHPAMGLYLFLVTVGNADGVSFYSDKTLQKRLGMSFSCLLAAKQCLVKEHLIAYRKPFYQVLALPSPMAQPAEPAARETSLRHLSNIKQTLEKKHD